MRTAQTSERPATTSAAGARAVDENLLWLSEHVIPHLRVLEHPCHVPHAQIGPRIRDFVAQCSTGRHEPVDDADAAPEFCAWVAASTGCASRDASGA